MKDQCGHEGLLFRCYDYNLTQSAHYRKLQWHMLDGGGIIANECK